MRTAMHEWPLVVFASLAIAGAGTLAVEPLLLAAGAGDPALMRQRAAWAAVLMVVGLVASLGHLGRPGRLALASRRFGASALSTEAVLGTVVAVAGSILALSPTTAPWTGMAAWGAALVACAFLVSMGLVYRLAGQVTWPASSVAGPLLLGLAYGVVAHVAAAPETMAGALVPAITLLAADAALFGVRWRRVACLDPWVSPSYARIFRHRHLLLASRLLFVDLAPVALLLIAAPTLADLSLGIGLLVDRLAFFGLAAQHTTEAEVARVESLLV